MIEIMKWTGVITAVMGQVLINRKNIFAYYSWGASSILMIIATFMDKDWPFFVLYSIYLCLNIEGLIKWSKNKKDRSEINE